MWCDNEKESEGATFLEKFFLVAAGDALRARSKNRKCYGDPSAGQSGVCTTQI